MRVYKTATTRAVPEGARYSRRKGVKCVTAVVGGKKITGQVTANGTMRIEADYYSLKFRDKRDIERYIRAYTDKRASEDLGKTITQLMEPDPDLSLAENIPARIRAKLVAFGIIDNKRSAAGRSLSELTSEYEGWLRTTRVERHGLLRCKEYCNDTITMITRIARSCKFYQWSDISKTALEKYLGNMDVKARTYNNYLVSIKGFCKWVVENDLAGKNPLTKCKHIHAEDKEIRRALTPEEFSLLLNTTTEAPRRFELTGRERAIMYLLAAELGLRKSELLSLTVSSFDLDKGTVTIKREIAKNRHAAKLPLKQQRVSQLREYLAGKFPNVKVFPVTASLRAGDMIKRDLKDAGIPFETDEGVCCFHALRHTFSTNVAKTNATWVEHKVLMRHSLKTDVTAGYTKVPIERQREIVEQLPGFAWPIQSMKAAG
jgi:integrase